MLNMLANTVHLRHCAIESGTQTILRQAVADVLLKAFLTRLLSRATTQDTLIATNSQGRCCQK